MSQSSSKWSVGNVFLFLLGIALLLATATFLALTLMQHYSGNPAQLWAAASSLFTLFGALLALGMAFAVLAAAMSYLSVNNKLKEAHQHLAQAQQHLLNYQSLSMQQQQMDTQTQELLKEYQQLPSKTAQDTKTVRHLAQRILASQHAQFEQRLLAHTIVQDCDADELSRQAYRFPEAETWLKAAHLAEITATHWQVLSMAATQDNIAAFQQAYLDNRVLQANALNAQLDANFPENSPPLINREHYRQMYALYAPILAQAEQGQAKRAKQVIQETAHRCGLALFREGVSLLQYDNQSINEVRRLWQQAQSYYQKALATQPKDQDAALLCGEIFDQEARLLVQTDVNTLPEARKLWLSARDFYRSAIDIEPSALAAYHWGDTLMDEATSLVQADEENLPEARILWQQAREKYQQSLSINPNFSEAAYRIGLALNKEADAILHIKQNIGETRHLWKQSTDYFQMAFNLNGDNAETVNGWGLVLAKEADLVAQLDENDLNEAYRLWQLAEQKFHRALEIDPNLQSASMNWRTVLLHEANALPSTEEKQALWLKTQEKAYALLHVSERHQQAMPVQELAEFIRQELLKLESAQQLQPVLRTPA